MSEFGKGPANPKWQGGTNVNVDGYLRICAGPLRGQYVARLVLAAKLGRPLREDEDAHHLDENRLNPSPDNLEVRPADPHRRAALARHNERRKKEAVGP
jgi:hypothetical protein